MCALRLSDTGYTKENQRSRRPLRRGLRWRRALEHSTRRWSHRPPAACDAFPAVRTVGRADATTGVSVAGQAKCLAGCVGLVRRFKRGGTHGHGSWRARAHTHTCSRTLAHVFAQTHAPGFHCRSAMSHRPLRPLWVPYCLASSSRADSARYLIGTFRARSKGYHQGIPVCAAGE
jgi:hypothetical protein